jgi:hypothetical protein
VIKKEAEKIINIKTLTIEIQHMWNVKNKSVTSNNRSSQNQLRIIHTLPEQHTGKACNQEMTKSSHIGHCAHTSESIK